MVITEVKVKPVIKHNGKLGAFCSLTIDDAIAIHDVKIIEGLKGAFVAMPTRKMMIHCNACGAQNPISASFCNECGIRMESKPVLTDKNGHLKFYVDIAHPINNEARELIHKTLIKEYQEAKARTHEQVIL